MLLYDYFENLQLCWNIFGFRQCTPFVPIVSAMPTFLRFLFLFVFLLWHFSAMPTRLSPLFFAMFSATPTFLLKLIFGYALFPALPTIVLLFCFSLFPPLYANRSNAIGGEGWFFHVFMAFALISANVYSVFLSVQRS